MFHNKKAKVINIGMIVRTYKLLFAFIYYIY